MEIYSHDPGPRMIYGEYGFMINAHWLSFEKKKLSENILKLISTLFKLFETYPVSLLTYDIETLNSFEIFWSHYEAETHYNVYTCTGFCPKYLPRPHAER